MPTTNIINTDIDGVTIELQSIHGEVDGAVLHMLPGGVLNPEGFGMELKDVYAFTAKGKDRPRGGHYHLKLNELFFPLAGTSLWVLSDMREGSKTHGTTIGIILGIDEPAETHGLPCHVLLHGTMPRLRVPAGVFHAIYPLTDERVTCVGIGSTPYDKDDYRYPTLEELPGATEIVNKFQS